MKTVHKAEACKNRLWSWTLVWQVYTFSCQPWRMNLMRICCVCSYNLVLPPDGAWGSLTSDGDWTGMTGMFHKKVHCMLWRFNECSKRVTRNRSGRARLDDSKDRAPRTTHFSKTVDSYIETVFISPAPVDVLPSVGWKTQHRVLSTENLFCQSLIGVPDRTLSYLNARNRGKYPSFLVTGWKANSTKQSLKGLFTDE